MVNFKDMSLYEIELFEIELKARLDQLSPSNKIALYNCLCDVLREDGYL